MSEIFNSEEKIDLKKVQETISPNLDGVIAPGLYLELQNGTETNTSFELTEFDIEKYIDSVFTTSSNQGEHLANPYHDVKHFKEVYERSAQLVTEARTIDQIFARQTAAAWHDFNHPGKNKNKEMSIHDIAKIYGEEIDEDRIREALNAMIKRDNELLDIQNVSLPVEKRGATRPLVSEMDTVRLTPEEISAFYADASLVALSKKTGKNIPLSVRALTNALIKATDFVNTRNYPKTGIEWQFKLADMANFLKPINAWLETAVKVGLEAPWGPPATLEKFLKGEIFFLKILVQAPILDNPVTVGLFPDEVRVQLIEKITYLENLLSEIERHKSIREVGTESQLSLGLNHLLEVTKPLFVGRDQPLY